jgi:hypothetical protein
MIRKAKAPVRAVTSALSPGGMTNRPIRKNPETE